MFGVAVSYFYQVRFFKPYMIPVSTAVWDPKWFHNFKGQDHCFIDKNGVINGLRNQALMPGSSCNNLCRGREHCNLQNPDTCDFLLKYREQLDTIDFGAFIKNLEDCSHRLKDLLGVDSDLLFVFIVHESPDNQCSERKVILKWLVDKGILVNELSYPIDEYYL